MAIQPQNKNLNYLIDPAFKNVNRLFVLSFQEIIIILIIEILSQIIMYQTLQLKILMF